MLNARLLILLSAVFFGCHSGPKRAMNQSELSAAESVAAIIRRLPPWAATTPGAPSSVALTFGAAEVDAFEVAAVQLQQFSLAEIRGGITQAIDDARNHGLVRLEVTRANIFALMRVAFDVPESVPPTLAIRSDYTSHVYTGGPYPQAWPAKFTTNGALEKLQPGSVPFGGRKAAVKDFDDVSAAYGFRTIPSCDSRCGASSPAEACQCLSCQRR